MATFKQRQDMQRFIRDLETVSVDLAAWAQQKANDGWTVEDCKIQLKAAANLCGRD